MVPRGSVYGAAAVLPWIILAGGLLLAALVGALGVNRARRARAQDELDRIFTLSADLIAAADFEGRFTRVNPAVNKILGYTQEEFLARPYLELVHPDDRERTADEAAAISEGRTTLSFENRYLGKDGSYRVLEWTSTPVVEQRVMYGGARDVTERHRAEAALARLAGEQAALRRVATLVARGVPPAEVFSAVAEEVERLLDAQATVIARLEPDGKMAIVASGGTAHDELPIGTRLELDSDTAVAKVLQTGRAARVDDYGTFAQPVAQRARRLGIRCSVAVPITVEGALWGSIAAGTERERFPADVERRMAEFTERAGTAIANAESRSELIAPRARVVAASDETRRRMNGTCTTELSSASCTPSSRSSWRVRRFRRTMTARPRSWTRRSGTPSRPPSIASMSVSARPTPASRAMASMCSTVFDEPPIAMSTTIALWMASAVTMRRSRNRSSPAISTARRAARRRSASRSGVSARIVPLPGSAIAHRLAEDVHRVRGEHPRARPARRAGAALDVVQLRVVHLAARALADRLEHRGEVDRRAVRLAPGLHRAAGDEHRRNVDAERAHDHAGDDLVAVRDAEERVETVRVHHRLDRVGDELARRQAVEHAGVAHRDPVVDADRVELERDAARLADLVLRDPAVLLEEEVARDDVDVAVRDPDEGLLEVRVGEAGRAEEASVGGPLEPLLDRVAAHDPVVSAGRHACQPTQALQPPACSRRAARGIT